MKRTLLAAAIAAFGSAASAGIPGYVTDIEGKPVRSGFGDCVHTGTWTPAQAIAACDPVQNSAPVVSAVPQPKEEPAPSEPTVEQAPAPLAAPVPQPPTLEKVALSTDVLFEFGSATLKPEGKQNLDELAGRMKDANVEQVVAVGHADRIGSEQSNQKLSEERAQAVTSYLQGNLKTSNLQAEGRGESQPMTGDDCKRMGAEQKKNRRLVDCLQPDRRVEIEVFGTRETAGQPGTAGIGGSAPR